MPLKIGIILWFLIPTLAIAQRKIIVGKSGKTDYTTVQAALDAIPSGNTVPYTIYIKKGVYREEIVVDARKNFITFIGEDRDSTILTFNNHAGTRLPNGDTLNTWTCASTLIYGNNFRAENISFHNTAGYTA
ncbi:MAG: pectin esterase, partial [Sediminibacterium sp.]|nr:pectin esterase [Sediminibacterium sp.]